MKVAVVSNIGGCGKTIVATQMLAPRLHAPIISVETTNESAELFGVEAEKMGAKKFQPIHAALSDSDDVILDVGASNINDFLMGLVKFDEAHMEIDYYVIPCTKGTRGKIECIKMISILADLGVPPDRIRVVFNIVEEDAALEFAEVINYVNQERNAVVNIAAAIYETELFSLLEIERMTVEVLLSDDNDYKALLREHRDASEDERARWREMLGLKALARSVNRNLDEVFNAVFA
jgi:hypothetical protein